MVACVGFLSYERGRLSVSSQGAARISWRQTSRSKINNKRSQFLLILFFIFTCISYFSLLPSFRSILFLIYPLFESNLSLPLYPPCELVRSHKAISAEHMATTARPAPKEVFRIIKTQFPAAAQRSPRDDLYLGFYCQAQLARCSGPVLKGIH